MTPGEAEKMRDIPHSIRVFEISGPLFRAAADEILTITSDKSTKVIVIRMRSVPASGSTHIGYIFLASTRSQDSGKNNRTYHIFCVTNIKIKRTEQTVIE